ncbi:MAG TPA: HEAT repeat domain-containing protein [Gemmatimonadales bacterium]|nr:HEAT repeat domain-containing protein [Gemmatimonadales bacterium]
MRLSPTRSLSCRQPLPSRPAPRRRAARAALLAGLVLALGLRPAPLRAQAESAVEILAPVLAAEDARRWDEAALGRAASAVEPLARSKAALAIGRIADLRGTPLLLRLLTDADSTVRTDAAFALGLMRDTAAVPTIIQRLGAQPALDTMTAAELMTSLARIGGRQAADFLGAVVQARAPLTVAPTQPLVQRAVGDAWRLGRLAPVAALVPMLDSPDPLTRQRAYYTLGRLRAPEAMDRMLSALRDGDAIVRANVTRALVRGYAESAQRPPATIARLLAPAVDDIEPGVRINAMRSLGTYRDSTLSPRVGPLVDDQFPQAQVQAAMTLGDLGGREAAAPLLRVLRSRAPWAVRREALVSLARVDTAAFFKSWDEWRTSPDWRDRAAAAEAWGRAAGGAAGKGAAAAPFFLSDGDGRVVAAGLQAWSAAADTPAVALVEAARARLGHPDAAVRSVAADVLARAPAPTDVPALATAYRRAAGDSFPEAMISALGALQAIARRSPADSVRVTREFLLAAPAPRSYVVRGWAEANWPAAGDRWGPAYPLQTGRTLQDYRELVRRFVLGDSTTATPHVIIETEQRGAVEIELAGPDAPLTVANFLRLVDQQFFNGNRWHRVVPNFVVQDGDPRGDGWGGPGGAIRDEINRRRYEKPVLGMALSGPDTGGSQWFINLSPQPHLDGTYTVFGSVVGGWGTLTRILQGDRIRTIHR